jgi:tetratricopeptide (TPR) repeat protein
MMGLFDKLFEVKDGKTANEWFELGFSAKHPEEQFEYYTKVLEIDPKLANAWNSKGNVLRLLGKHDEAIRCFDKAFEINPKFAIGVLINKGDTFHSLGRYDEVMECYDKALEIDPGHEKAKQENCKRKDERGDKIRR